jgi:hypothetical protein
MATDPIEEVLRLVAEGRLTADEAAPILAALDERGPARPPRPEPPGGFGPTPPPGTPPPGTHGGGSSLRIEVKDGGRTVVNLRLPAALGRYALDRLPGLASDQGTSVRNALSSGVRGPILEVDDDGDGVRIVLE